MTAIWSQDDAGWRLVSPSGFPAEEALHDLVEQAPNMLPLSGSPQLTIVGREVYLGGNKADLIAIEPSGRLTIIEIKLVKGGEARRAVVAQILTYAAFLRGLSVEAVENDVLGTHLAKREYTSLAGAVLANDQSGAFEPASFAQELADSLAGGRFRLVLVLDDAPPELVQLVGYLEAVAEKLVIDLVTVAAYDIGGTKVMVPQRVDPERIIAPAPLARSTITGATFVLGTAPFEESIETAPLDQRELLRRLVVWAKHLEQKKLAVLGTTIGKGRWLLRPLVPTQTERVGLVTIFNERGPSLNFHRTVIERCAPNSLSAIEKAAHPIKVGQGNNTSSITDALLATLTDAYVEAAGSQ